MGNINLGIIEVVGSMLGNEIRQVMDTTTQCKEASITTTTWLGQIIPSERLVAENMKIRMIGMGENKNHAGKITFCFFLRAHDDRSSWACFLFLIIRNESKEITHMIDVKYLEEHIYLFFLHKPKHKYLKVLKKICNASRRWRLRDNQARTRVHNSNEDGLLNEVHA